MSPADRAQLQMWRIMLESGACDHRAAAGALLALAERLAAEVAALEDGARADAAEIAGLRASVVPWPRPRWSPT